MKINCNIIECCNNTHHEAPRTSKQTCACASDLGDGSHATCRFMIRFLFMRFGVFSSNTLCTTSNVTGRHRGPKRKLRAGYWAPSRYRRAMCRHSYFCLLDVPSLCNASHIFHRQVWYHALSLRCARAMRVFDVRASFSPPRLPLCQISFLSRTPLLS